MAVRRAGKDALAIGLSCTRAYARPMLTILESSGLLTIDLRYATADNLTGGPLYERPVAMLLPEAAARLLTAARQAQRIGLRLRIFDAFRPVEAQWALWNAVADKRFVSDPRSGGVHPRGAAVDLTLEHAGTGEALDMGTGFDAITDLSAHGSAGVSPEATRNRALLLGLMTAAGWDRYGLEWWHYQLFSARSHPALHASAVPGGPM